MHRVGLRCAAQTKTHKYLHIPNGSPRNSHTFFFFFIRWCCTVWNTTITCSLVQIWHNTNYLITSASTSAFRKQKRKEKHAFQDLSFATEGINNIANGWLIQHGVRGSSLKHTGVYISCVSNTTQSTGTYLNSATTWGTVNCQFVISFLWLSRSTMSKKNIHTKRKQHKKSNT